MSTKITPSDETDLEKKQIKIFKNYPNTVYICIIVQTSDNIINNVTETSKGNNTKL
jgi:hypothetical protein